VELGTAGAVDAKRSFIYLVPSQTLAVCDGNAFDAAYDCGGVKIEGRRHGQRKPMQAPGQRAALEQFHDEEAHAVLEADVVDGEDVRVVQRAGRAGLELEPTPALRIGRRRFGQHLDGDRAIETCVAGPVDLAHATGAQRCEDLVWTEAAAGCKAHRRSLFLEPASCGSTREPREEILGNPASLSHRRSGRSSLAVNLFFAALNWLLGGERAEPTTARLLHQPILECPLGRLREAEDAASRAG
jgi:hypothetical protein